MVFKEALDLNKNGIINSEEFYSMLFSNDYNDEDIIFFNKLIISIICTGIMINILEKNL